MVSDQHLPLITWPQPVTTPAIARLALRLLEAGERECRRNGVNVPTELQEWIGALEVTAAWRVSASGHRVDEGADMGAGSADATTASSSEPWATTAQAAERLGRSEHTIGRLCRTGQLRARKAGRAWLVDPAALEERSARDVAAG